MDLPEEPILHICREVCRVGNCEWFCDGPSHDYTGAMATWHVYEEHPNVWRAIIGDRPPLDPDPRTPEGRAIIFGGSDG